MDNFREDETFGVCASVSQQKKAFALTRTNNGHFKTETKQQTKRDESTSWFPSLSLSEFEVTKNKTWETSQSTFSPRVGPESKHK